MSEIPEADRIEGAPHPREAARLYGQEAAERALLAAHAAGRIHHAWLLAGPRGIGKATLAWRAARFLLAGPAGPAEAPGLFGEAPAAPESLDVPPDHPVARRLAAGAEGRLILLRRAWDDDRKRLATRISVDEMRRLRDFFALSAPDGGWRVVIVDAADEMNPAAANALLKHLEEPPPRAVFFLVSHRPAGLLPTIRSRCRVLPLAPLGPEALAAALAQAGVEAPEPAALAELAGGSAGAAVGLVAQEGLALYARLVRLFASLPRLDRAQALALAEEAGGRGNEARRDLLFALLDLLMARIAAAGAGRLPVAEAAPGEAALLARLAPDPAAARAWAEAQARLGARARAGLAVNLDPAALFLDMLLQTEAIAVPRAARATPD
jgi:DNA polymerase-3 subunit delta'